MDPMYSYDLGYEWALSYHANYGYHEPQWPNAPQETLNWAQASYPVQAAANVEFPYGHNTLPLHAPVPRTGAPPILFTDTKSQSNPHRPMSPVTSYHSVSCSDIDGKVATQRTFLTPCELLDELNHRNAISTSDAATPHPVSPTSSSSPVIRNANNPSDSEAITSHERKRQYLECIEQYIAYLHEQLKLVGAVPLPIERVSNYRGMNSRNVRTLLAYMENSNAKLKAKARAEEQRFLTLRDAYLRQEDGARSDLNEVQECFSSPSPSSTSASVRS
ncbi:hypothetical protein D9757_002871 [Collybiopsis confluens]|uniref:Uncharacterized protein n=1 Tax=Collybiopsis confluens TaxID=2823264 RepID=A0A8H5HVF7_9AGAR|nr:hypothetical protein D9757_002871 [Collybiopsis confluens]